MMKISVILVLAAVIAYASTQELAKKPVPVTYSLLGDRIEQCSLYGNTENARIQCAVTCIRDGHMCGTCAKVNGEWDCKCK